MTTLRRYGALLVAGTLSLAASLCALSSQSRPPAQIIGAGAVIRVSANFAATLRFYRDVLQLRPSDPGSSAGRAPDYEPSGPWAQLYALPGDARVAVADFQLPAKGTDLEIVAFQGVRQKAVRPQAQDPGASTLVLTVRQIDPILRRAHAAHAPIVSANGIPVEVDEERGKTRSAVLVDPDGNYVELIEHVSRTPQTAGTSTELSNNLVQAAVMLTIADTDRSARFYHGLLGLPLKIDAEFSPDKALSDAFGVAHAQFRHTTAVIGGSGFRYDFVEWRNVARRPAAFTAHDPGATVLRLTVRDVGSALMRLRSAGFAPTSTGNGLVALSARRRASIIGDPNGLFIEPIR